MSTVERHAAVPLGGAVTMDQVLALAPVKEVVVVHGATAGAGELAGGAFNLRAEQFALMPVGRTPFGARGAGPGPDRQHAEQQPGHDRRRVRLRQRVPDGRRRHQRQRPRPAEQPVHRGRDPGSAGADLGHLRRVRPFQRRRGQRDHARAAATCSRARSARTSPIRPGASRRRSRRAPGTTRASKLSPTYELTLGGPIVRDRVWFFGGSRIERTTTQGTFAQTRIPYTSQNDNTRYEGKLTGTIATGHTLQGTFIDNRTDLVQPAFGGSIDPAAMTTPSTPEPPLRGDLARRARRAHVRDRAVLAEVLEARRTPAARARASSTRRS